MDKLSLDELTQNEILKFSRTIKWKRNPERPGRINYIGTIPHTRITINAALDPTTLCHDCYLLISRGDNTKAFSASFSKKILKIAYRSVERVPYVDHDKYEQELMQNARKYYKQMI